MKDPSKLKRLISLLKWEGILSQNEAECCIIAIRNRDVYGGGEAVLHYGGAALLMHNAIRDRAVIREIAAPAVVDYYDDHGNYVGDIDNEPQRISVQFGRCEMFLPYNDEPSDCDLGGSRETGCGIYILCDSCFSWMMGRITCPFHGDDNCNS